MRVYRDGEEHEIRDLTVSVALSGDLEAVHLEGDNAAVLATDTQKNTVYAFAKEHRVGPPEEFARAAGAALPRRGDHEGAGRGAASAVDAVERPRVHAVRAASSGSARSCRRGGPDLRRVRDRRPRRAQDHPLRVPRLPARQVHDAAGDDATACSPPRSPRAGAIDGTADYDTARAALIEAFAAHHSLSLQQTLYAMGEALLDACPAVARGPAEPARTSITSSSTSPPSGSRTRTRSSTPTTARTG